MGGYENICCSLSPHHIAFCHNSVLKKSHYTLAPISTGSPQSCTVLITFTCWRYHLLVAYSVQFLTGLSPLWRKERLTEKHRNIKITFSMLFGIKMLICSNAVGHKKPLHRLLQGCHLCFFFFLLLGGSDICLRVNCQLTPSALWKLCKEALTITYCSKCRLLFYRGQLFKEGHKIVKSYKSLKLVL